MEYVQGYRKLPPGSKTRMAPPRPSGADHHLQHGAGPVFEERVRSGENEVGMFNKACVVGAVALASLGSAQAYVTSDAVAPPDMGVPVDPEKSGLIATAALFEQTAKAAGVATAFGTESFESASLLGASGPLKLTLGEAGSATLNGNGTVIANPSNVGELGRYSAPGGTQFFEVISGSGQSFTIDFGNEVSVFSFWGTDIGDFEGSLTLELYNGTEKVGEEKVSTAQGADSSGSLQFFGLFVDTKAGDRAFTSIRFVTSGSRLDGFGFDSFTIGTNPSGGDVPEPATFALAGLALAGLALSRRRRA